MSKEDPEAFVKNYQLEALSVAINSIISSNARIETKIDNQLVTKEQLEASLTVVGLNLKTVDEKYDPMKKNLSRITWVVIGALVPLIILSCFQLLKNIGQSSL